MPIKGTRDGDGDDKEEDGTPGGDYIRETQGRCLDIWVVTLAKSRPVEREVEKQIGIRCALKKSQAKKNDVRSFSSSSNFLNVVVMMWMMIEGIFKKDVSKKKENVHFTSSLHLYLCLYFVFVFVFPKNAIVKYGRSHLLWNLGQKVELRKKKLE